MAKKQHKEYILSSGRVNRHGYRIDLDGMNLKDFMANPIILDLHNERKHAVGKLTIRKEGNQLLGVPEFDLEDEHGKNLDRKYRKGFMNAFSVHFRPLAFSSDPKDILPGQTRPTIIKSDLLEVSCVNIPGDAGAVRLMLNANQEIDDVLPKLNFKQEENSEMKEILEALKLSADASEADAVKAINALKQTATEALSAKAESIVALGLEKGAITESNKDIYLKLAHNDYDSVKSLVDNTEAKPAAEETPTGSLSATIAKHRETGTKPVEEAEETFESLSKNNPKKLLKIKQEDPERYKALALAYAEED